MYLQVFGLSDQVMFGSRFIAELLEIIFDLLLLKATCQSQVSLSLIRSAVFILI